MPSQRLVIRARAVAAENLPLEDKLLVISGKRIETILPSTAANRFSGQSFVGSRRYLVFPGLVDAHCHGGGGTDPATLGGLLATAFFHATQGTLAMLLTVFYTGPEDLAHMADLIKKARPDAPLRLLGLHLEGPMLNLDACGAIPRQTIRPLTEAEIPKLLAAADGELRMLTIAPELPGAEGVIRKLTAAGVTVALGHSLATAEQAKAAVEWGARVVTHLGNAMRPFHQRDPGLVGTALADPRLTAEIIADGQHLAPETLSMFLRGKIGELMLVSDCRWVGGMPENIAMGEAGDAVQISAGAARRPDGSLAGGAYPVWKGVTTVAGLPGFNIWEAVRMAAANPAKALGLRGIGKISVGGRADLVLAGPDFSVRRVFYGGEEVFRATGEPALTL